MKNADARYAVKRGDKYLRNNGTWSPTASDAYTFHTLEGAATFAEMYPGSEAVTL